MFLLVRGTMLVGGQSLTVSVGWHIYSQRGNVLDLGLIGLAQFLPVLVLFLLAGIAADRFDRNKIVGTSALFQTGVIAAIALYFTLDISSALWPVLVLLAMVGGARAFYHPASQAMLPLIVPRSDFHRAVAIAGSVGKAAQLGGPALGGFLILTMGEGSYWMSAGAYLIGAVASFLIHPRTEAKVRQSLRGMAAILEGFNFIRQRQVLFGVITMDLIAVLFGSVVGLLPVFAIDILHVGPEWLGVLRATPAAGALLIAIALARGKIARPNGRTLFTALVIFGASILVFALSHWLWLSIVALAIYGASDMVSIYVRQTVIQMETPDELRGRVSAVNSVSINASNELGDFRAGTMAAMVGAVPAIAIGGIATLAVAALWWRWFPKLRNVEPAE